ncbi:substrate-binding domain-containing protein, partial [Frankia sp. CiP3]
MMPNVSPGDARSGNTPARGRPPGTRRRRLVARFVAIMLIVAAAGGAGIGATPPASADAPYAAVAGSGSTWSEIMISQWVRDVRKNGLPVNYTGNGSSSGRSDYWNGLNDFAVSEIPFQPRIPGSNDTDELPLAARRPYAYLPIVAGGTSFMYHLTVAGKQVTNLRLSGETLTKIFTGVITNWSDAAITRDNGRQLPDKAITPV